MAGFYDTRTLDRQERRINPDYVTGPRATALGLLGYKKTGETNTWGKTLGVMGMLNPMGGLYRHHGAKAIAGDNDTREALKQNDAQAMNVALNKLKLSAEVAKVVATSGAGAAGAGASAGGATAAGASGSGVAAGSTGTTAAGGMGGFGSTFSGTEGGSGVSLLSDVLEQGGGSPTIPEGPRMEPPPPGDVNYGSYVSSPEYNVGDSSGVDYSSYTSSPDAQNPTGDATNTTDKLSRFNDKMNMIMQGGLIDSGINTVNAMRMYNMMGERTARSMRSRTTASNFNYL
ncbi:MAG: hypothetical protein ACTSPB_03390 [Candidatus Thorarchaeota archaeon]